MAVYCAADLRIPDFLSDGPATAEPLASRAGANRGPTTKRRSPRGVRAGVMNRRRFAQPLLPDASRFPPAG